MRSSLLCSLTALTVAVLAFGVPAHASLLAPGTTLYPAPGEPDPAGGVAVGGPMTLPFAAGTFSGSLTTTVLSGDVSNPWGGLTFIYELTNDAVSIDAIHRLTINGFAIFQTDASYQVGPFPIGLVPTMVDRSLNGDVVGFSFLGVPVGPGELLPGFSSAVLVVQTDAPSYSQSFASVIDGTVTSVGTYSPIPEPLTMGLMLMGTAMVLIRRR